LLSRKIIGRQVAAALLCVALAACQPPGTVMAGKEFDYGLAKRQKIVKGVTTKADIQTLFGDPYSTSKSGNGETWEYYSRESNRDEAYADRTLIIDFNERAVVTDYKYRWKETKSPSNVSGGHGRTPPPPPDNAPCTAPPPPGNPMLPGSVNQRPTGAC
jgi:outer membrane protein assembly factor BamE (lipoprotein component of BamABCDE complex)